MLAERPDAGRALGSSGWDSHFPELSFGSSTPILMAPVGHGDTQAPSATQRSRSMCATSRMVMACVGQYCSQRLHVMHSTATTHAFLSSGVSDAFFRISSLFMWSHHKQTVAKAVVEEMFSLIFNNVVLEPM